MQKKSRLISVKRGEKKRENQASAFFLAGRPPLAPLIFQLFRLILDGASFRQTVNEDLKIGGKIAILLF